MFNIQFVSHYLNHSLGNSVFETSYIKIHVLSIFQLLYQKQIEYKIKLSIVVFKINWIWNKTSYCCIQNKLNPDRFSIDQILYSK